MGGGCWDSRTFEPVAMFDYVLRALCLGLGRFAWLILHQGEAFCLSMAFLASGPCINTSISDLLNAVHCWCCR